MENITVVCSTRVVDETFEKMVRKMSGVKNEDLEFLIYENNGEMSLTQVYNKGLIESKNDIVLFIHDDVEILSKNWAKKLAKHYETTEYGILGVAGGKSLGEAGVWWHNRESMYGCVFHTNGSKTWLSEYSYNFGDRIKEVVVVDGVFMSCHKKRIKKTFDEYYDKFHFYDISFSFDNYKEDVKIGVHFDINILHKSVGEISEQWNDSRLKFIGREAENLPQTVNIDVFYTEPVIKMKNEKKLAIVIPTKNHVDDLLIPCVESIVQNTHYRNYKIYIADTGSSEEELKKTKEFIETMNIVNRIGKIVVLIEYDYYNFAKINNDVIKNKIDKDTELVLLCNNDIEMLNDAISIMVETHNKNPRVGTVGARLHYENGSIQHLGVSLQINKKEELVITHKYLNWDVENVRLSTHESCTHGNTGAFMLVSTKLFNEIGGLNESYGECFEDVEFNLQCMLKNKVNITTDRAVCYHLESQTRTRTGENVDLQILLNFINQNPTVKKTFNRID